MALHEQASEAPPAACQEAYNIGFWSTPPTHFITHWLRPYKNLNFYGDYGNHVETIFGALSLESESGHLVARFKSDFRLKKVNTLAKIACNFQIYILAPVALSPGRHQVRKAISRKCDFTYAKHPLWEVCV
jgi:hypothetical protein